MPGCGGGDGGSPDRVAGWELLGPEMSYLGRSVCVGGFWELGDPGFGVVWLRWGPVTPLARLSPCLILVCQGGKDALTNQDQA